MSEAEFWDGAVIHRYTRAQAIEDGVLMDLTALHPAEVKECGYLVPVAMTATAYQQVVACTPKDLQAGQSPTGRIWDVLFVLRDRIKRHPQASTVGIMFSIAVYRGDTDKTDYTDLQATIGPGDAGEPVLTIMLEGED